MSVESQTLDQLEAALAGITVANGYQTDIGSNVFRNLEYETAPDDSLWPCTVLFPGELSSGLEGEVLPECGQQNNFLPISIEAYTLDDARGTIGQKAKDDLRKILSDLGYFGGLVELVQDYKSSAKVNPGADSYWSSITASFVIFYVTPWGEN